MFYPVTKFMNKEEFTSVINKMQLSNKKFFPFPIYLNPINKFNNKYKNANYFELYYNKTKVCKIKNESIYNFKKKNLLILSKKLFQSKKEKHPGIQKFINQNNFYISGKIYSLNNKINNLVKFKKPSYFKKKFKNLQKICGFHSRNVPHAGHQWLHNLALSKCKNLLIHPLIGQYAKGEYTEYALIKSHEKLMSIKSSEFKKKNYKVFLNFLNLYPKYAGPREALLHAIIRKNYGCTHFLVGRDHAGIKNYYSKYASQKICKKYKKKIGIKIISFVSPKYCNKCKNIMNKKCFKCINSKLIDINGSYIRKILKKNKKICKHLFNTDLISSISKNKLLI